MAKSKVVSVRLPKKMYEDLEKKADKDQFLDISEAVKSIVRKKYLEYNKPGGEINKVRGEIVDNIQKKVDSKVQDQLLSELQKIKEILEGGKN